MLGLLSDTVNTANASVPSTTAGLLTATLGVSSSAPPAPLPSSRIVPIPAPSAIKEFTALDRFTVKASLCSKIASSVIASVIVWLVTPGAKVSVPLSASAPAP